MFNLVTWLFFVYLFNCIQIKIKINICNKDSYLNSLEKHIFLVKILFS
jgi:hypothetical protein